MRELQLCAHVSHELKAKRETGGREKNLEEWYVRLVRGLVRGWRVQEDT